MIHEKGGNGELRQDVAGQPEYQLYFVYCARELLGVIENRFDSEYPYEIRVHL